VAGEALITLNLKLRAEASVAPVADVAGGVRTNTCIRAEGYVYAGMPGSIRAGKRGRDISAGTQQPPPADPDAG
jgi:hypothetical protein